MMFLLVWTAVWTAVSVLFGGAILLLMYAFRKSGPQSVKQLYLLQLILVIAAIAVLHRNAMSDIQNNPLDGPAGAFQGMEVGTALLVGFGAQLVVLVGLPWLLSRSGVSTGVKSQNDQGNM